MMERIKAYVLSICAAALICAIVIPLLGKKGPSSALGKMICCIFLTIMVLRPFTDKNLLSAISFEDSQVNWAVEQGKAESKRAMAAIIKQQTEAYILQKAAQYQATLTVQVFVSKDALPVPEAVHLRGSISPYAKTALGQYLTDTLGIPKENQQWS